MQIELFRQSDNGIQTLSQGECGDFLFYAVELPWRDNQVGISCIPPGEYDIIQHYSPSFGPCYWLPDVPGRSEILIHPANHYHQLRGCIAPGLSWADIDGDDQVDVTNSRKAVKSLLELKATSIKIWGIGG